VDAYEGWAADPFGGHEVRYFVDGRPTKLVRDGSVETFDDVPLKSNWRSTPSATEPSVPAPSSALVFEPVTQSEPVFEPIFEPVTELESVFASGSEPAVEPVSQSEPVFEPIFEPVTELESVFATGSEPAVEPVSQSEPVFEPASAPAPMFEPLLEQSPSLASESVTQPSPPPPPAGTSYWAPPPPPASPGTEQGGAASVGIGPLETFVVGSTSPRRRPRRRLVTSLVALVMAAAGGGFFLVVGSGKSAEAAVIDSVNSTMADRTAHVSMNMTVSTPSADVTGTGTGSVDFSQNGMQLQLTVGTAGQQIQIQAVYVAGSIYEQIPGIDQVIPGKSWISLDLSSLSPSSSQSSSALGSGDNPTAMLRLLAQQGNTVVPLGSSTIAGTPVQGYSVTMDPAAIKAKLAQTNLPAWMTTALSHLNIQNSTLMVYVDGSGLLRRFSMNLTETAATTGKVTVDESLDFSDYGAPVNVSAPPPDQVASLSQLLQVAGAASGSTST
jgi:hypothetical protein